MLVLSYMFNLFFVNINSDVQREITYNLDINPIVKTINNNKVIEYQINKSDFAPIIKANKDDILIIKVKNNTDISTTIHWHGVLLPNNMDGVDGVNMVAIKPHSSFTYKFKVKQVGTYWYHAHGLEEAQGIYGGIIFKDTNAKENKEEEDDDHLLIYSGEIDKSPLDILNSLKPKQVQQSNQHNHMNMEMSVDSKNEDKDKMESMDMESMDMESMDMKNHYSDATYANYLINSKPQIIEFKKIQNNKIKLRLINAYVDGYLNFVYSGGDIKVVASDGIDVAPTLVKNLRVAMGETYDIILDVPSNNSYELVAFVLGSDKYSKVLVGSGKFVELDSYDYKNYSQSQPYKLLQSINYEWLNFDTFNNTKEYKLSLKGNHKDYNWSIEKNKQTLSELNVKTGDKIKIKITNHTHMPHPMHLHGYFFKVLSNPNTLIKHTFNLDHMESVEIEFIADEMGKWLLHCHNLFHMYSGMMITINVEK